MQTESGRGRAFLHRHGADVLAVAALTGLFFLWFAEVIFGGRNFFLRDITRYYYPMKQILPRIVSSGEFPYWNRLVGAGQPFAANPEFEVFYPPTWLLCLPDYYAAFRGLILAHVFIGMISTYALLRDMRCRAAAAAYGALAFALGGAMLSVTNLWPYLLSAAWLPLVAMSARRLFRCPSAAAFAATAGLLGMQLIICEPTIPIQTAILIALYGIWRASSNRERFRSLARNLLLLAAVTAAALAVATAAWLPAIDLTRDGVRSRGLSPEMSTSWSTPPPRLAELFYPNFMGHISPMLAERYWARSWYPGHFAPFYFSIYCGLLTAILSLSGLLLRRHGWPVPLAVICIALSLALGSHLAPSDWVWRSPLLSWMRYPEKFLFVVPLVVSLFGALMLERLLSGDHGLRRCATGLSIAAAVVAALCAVGLSQAHSLEAFAALWRIPPVTAMPGLVALARRDWIAAAVRGAVVTGVLLAFPRFRRMAGSVAVILLVLDLAPVAHELIPTMPGRFFDTAPIASALPARRSEFRLFHAAAFLPIGSDAEKYFALPTPSAWIYRNGLYPELPAGAGIESVLEADAVKTHLLPSVEFERIFRQALSAGRTDAAEVLLAMSNVWYRVVERPFDVEIRRHPRIEDLRPVRFLAGPQYPRYYFASRMISIGGNADRFLDEINAAPALAHGTAFVEGDAFPPWPGRITGVRETANTADLLVEASGKAFLIMSVTAHKYWRATIDGRPAVLRPVNVAYQGVGVEPGRHRIRMEYANPLVPVGVAVSATAILALAVAAAAGRSGARRRGAQT